MSREEIKPQHATVSWAGGERPPLQQNEAAPALGNARYTIEERLGAGGMGVVYAAHDRELGRRVALKLLRFDESSPIADASLQREAQAMARLQHPNAVAVYDVGRLESGQLFVAMELVQGQSLRSWLLENRHGWREIVTAYLHAGRGLAAAHEAGLIHRDFKPDNVLIGRDGSVRVADFGLAQPQAAAGSLPARLAGTPRYMSPEQRAGAPIDARSDQYSFCVALHESLFGAHPIEPELNRDTNHKTGRTAPQRLRAPLLRGLREKPEERWPGMPALLDALAQASRPRRRLLFAGVSTALALLAALAAYTARRSELCSGADQAFGDAWSDGRRAKIGAEFAGALPARGAKIFDEVDQTIARYREAWTAMYVDACRATRFRGEQSEPTLDLRMRCLDERRRNLLSLSSLLESADAATVERSLSVAQRLPEISFCANVSALSASAQPPVEASRRAAVDALAHSLTEEDLRHRLRPADESAARVDALIARIRPLEQRPLLARALLLRAEISKWSREMTRPCSEAAEAAALAFESRDDAAAADAWTALAEYQGERGSLEESDESARLAQAAIVRLGGDPLREAELLFAKCKARITIGESFSERRTVCEQARARLGSVLGPDDLRIADADDALGLVNYIEARYQPALALYRQALEQRTRLLGVDHMRRDVSRINIDAVLADSGGVDEALADLRELMQSHPNDAGYPWGVAEALHKKGQLAEALSFADRSLAAYRQQGDTNYVAAVQVERAEILLELGRAREALAALDEALETHASLTPTARARGALAFARAAESARPKDLPRARVSLQESRAALADSAARFGGPYRLLLSKIEGWLSAHPP